MNKKISKLIKNKKVLLLILIFLSIISFFFFKSFAKDKKEITYTTAKIEKGILINAISGSGQVTSIDQVDLKSKTSGKIVYVNLQNGKKVNQGELLLKLDTTEAQKNVWNAEINLENAKLSSKDLSKESNEELSNIYNNILNALNSNYQEISNTFPKIQSMFVESSYDSSDQDNKDVDYYLRLVRFIQRSDNIDIDLSYWSKTAEQQYNDIKSKYELIQTKSWFLNSKSSGIEIESALTQSYENNKLMLDLVRQTLSLTQKYQYLISSRNITTPITTSITNNQVAALNNLNSVLVSNTSSLNNLKSSLESAKETNKKVGVNSEAQALTISQKELDLEVANTNLQNHFVYAPFAGILTSVNNQIKLGEQSSSNTSVATIITNQQVAEITLNEVDVAKVKIGQKANITFDAIADLNLTGTVMEIDAVGNVSQGVVTYNIRISFDHQDERIKQGMSLSVSIITDIKTDVYLLSTSGVKSDSIGNYVEVLNQEKTSEKKYITIGLSNDTQTEIVSGLSEDDNVILRTTSKTNTNRNTQNTINMPGMGSNVMRMR